MENGGNKKVNIIWEANLARSGGRKPTTGADLSSRERYIRDKYERRKFYDPNALVDFQDTEPSFDEIGRGANAPDGFADFGPPSDGMVSDAAKLRAEKKKKKSASRNKSTEGGTTAKFKPTPGDVGKKSRSKKAEAVPEQVVDLLDLGGGGGSTLPTSASSQTTGDFADFFVGGATENVTSRVIPDGDSTKQQSALDHSKNRSDVKIGLETADQETTWKTQQDIMSMYGPGSASPMGGPMTGSGMAYNMTANPADMMAVMQRMQQMSMTTQQSQMMAMNMGINPQQQMQTLQEGAGQSKTDARLAMHQNLMMQQMQSQMRQQQQMQRMSQQGQVAYPNSGQQQGVNPQMMQAMMNANRNSSNKNMVQGGQMTPNAYMMGMNQNTAMAMNPGLMGQNMIPQQAQQQPQMNQFGGIAMSNAPDTAGQNGAAKSISPEKKDPFAHFSMNAFR